MYQSGNWVEQVFGNKVLKRKGSNVLGVMFRNKSGKSVGLTGSTIDVMFLSSKGVALKKQATISNHYTAIISINENDITDFKSLRIEFIIKYADGNQEIFPSGNHQRILLNSSLGNIQGDEIGHVIFENLSSKTLTEIEGSKEKIQDCRETINMTVKSPLSLERNNNANIEKLPEFIDGDQIINSQNKVQRINVISYGAVGDWNGSSGTDDTIKILDAINACESLKSSTSIPELYFPLSGGYKITSSISIPNGISIRMEGPLIYVGNENVPALIIGSGGGETNSNIELYLQVIRRTLSDWSSESCIGIQFLNLNESQVFIKQVRKFTIGVQFVGENKKGNAYNNIILGSLNGNKIALELVARYGGWTNENSFFNGRIWVSNEQNNGKSRYGIRLRNIDAENPNFLISTAYNIDDLLQTNGKVYKVVSSGVSGEVAPLHTSGICENGTAALEFMYNINQLNNNVMWKPSFELQSVNSFPGEAIPILIENGYQNTFRSCRSDGNGRTLAKVLNESTENKIEFGYSSHLDKIEDQSLYPATKLDITRRLFIDNPGSAICTFHNIQERACLYDGNFTTHVSGMFLGNSGSSNIYKALDKIIIHSDYIELGPARSLGIFVNTSIVKRFLIRREVIAENEGRVAIRCYNSSGVLLTNKPTYVKSMSYSRFFFDPNYGGVYKTGTDHSDDLYINIDKEVTKIAILFVNGTNTLKIRGFSIHSLDGHHASISCGYQEMIPGVNLGTSPPKIGTWPRGKIVLNDNKVELGSIGNKYIIDSWECIVGGTPGVWIQKQIPTGI
ncbi:MULTISPECIES: pectate lyase family protein [Priestia]|uniref:hypothetical protein n=1 Tax=Priestia sp. FSL P4-0332 TaxID=2921634 RepID=UPI0030F8320F